MSNVRVEMLIEKLNSMLDDKSMIYKKPSALSSAIHVTPDMDVESLSENDSMLLHTVLHQFYATGTDTIEKKDIEKLHEQVKHKVNHKEFDGLDKK